MSVELLTLNQRGRKLDQLSALQLPPAAHEAEVFRIECSTNRLHAKGRGIARAVLHKIANGVDFKLPLVPLVPPSQELTQLSGFFDELVNPRLIETERSAKRANGLLPALDHIVEIAHPSIEDEDPGVSAFLRDGFNRLLPSTCEVRFVDVAVVRSELELTDYEKEFRTGVLFPAVRLEPVAVESAHLL